MTYTITVWDWEVRDVLTMTFDNKAAAERQMAQLALSPHTFKNAQLKESK